MDRVQCKASDDSGHDEAPLSELRGVPSGDVMQGAVVLGVLGVLGVLRVEGETATLIARWANFNDMRLSSRSLCAGDKFRNIKVLAVPPRESCII
jgi:hypothetical protein